LCFIFYVNTHCNTNVKYFLNTNFKIGSKILDAEETSSHISHVWHIYFKIIIVKMQYINNVLLSIISGRRELLSWWTGAWQQILTDPSRINGNSKMVVATSSEIHRKSGSRPEYRTERLVLRGARSRRLILPSIKWDHPITGVLP